MTIVLVGHGVVTAAATPKQKVEFMRAMKSGNSKRNTRQLNQDTEKEFKKTLYGTSKESSALRKKIIEKAIMDVNKDGKLSKDEYMSKQKDPAHAAENFVKFDRDKSGELTKDEFVKMGK